MSNTHKVRVQDLKPGDIVVMPWGDLGADEMTVASVGRRVGHRVDVMWSDDTGNSFRSGALVDLLEPVAR